MASWAAGVATFERSDDDATLARLLEVAGRPPWQAQAACRGVSSTFFYPVKGGYHDARRAMALCRKCPVQAECLAYALAQDEQYGIWGGRVFQRVDNRPRVA